MSKLSARLAWLMDKDEQAQRPAQDRHRWSLQNGLNLHVLQAGQLFVLAMWRWEIEPSDDEVKTLVKTIKGYERPSPTFIATAPALIFIGKGKNKHARYIMFSFSDIEIHQQGATEPRQIPLIEMGDEKRTSPHNYTRES